MKCKARKRGESRTDQQLELKTCVVLSAVTKHWVLCNDKSRRINEPFFVCIRSLASPEFTIAKWVGGGQMSHFFLFAATMLNGT